MKKFIPLAMLLAFSSCKKDSVKIPATYNVIFQFSPDNNVNNMTLTNEQTGKVQTFNNQSTSLNIPAVIHIGDKYELEMSGNGDSLDPNYYIGVLYKNEAIAKDSPGGSPGVKERDTKFEMVFSSVNFQ